MSTQVLAYQLRPVPEDGYGGARGGGAPSSGAQALDAAAPDDAAPGDGEAPPYEGVPAITFAHEQRMIKGEVRGARPGVCGARRAMSDHSSAHVARRGHMRPPQPQPQSAACGACALRSHPPPPPPHAPAPPRHRTSSSATTRAPRPATATRCSWSATATRAPARRSTWCSMCPGSSRARCRSSCQTSPTKRVRAR